ncbi:MAG: DUF6110 family protein [Eggerthellaceae bacterium]|nr:DUF6110 family protein [Eggerthellaceae bacterium]
MHPGILIGAGFLLGTAGVKAVTSKPAKKAYVKGIVCGMKAKESVESMVDEAKAEFDDLMAEAGYERAEGGEGFMAIEEADAENGEAEADEPKPAAAAEPAKSAKSKKAAK